MYGVINICVERVIEAVFGNEVLRHIRTQCGIQATFVPHQHYPDATTLALIDHAIAHDTAHSRTAWHHAVGSYFITYLQAYGMRCSVLSSR